MNNQARAKELRQRYLAEAVETATPAGRLIMLFDALEYDLFGALKAFDDTADLKKVNDCLVHAQQILCLLRDTIDVSAWEPASTVQALYDHLFTELLKANMGKDREKVAEVAAHVTQLATAWREAARKSDAEPAALQAAG